MNTSPLLVRSQGFATGKINPFADNLVDAQNAINHHGSIYTDVFATLYLTEGGTLNLQTTIQNPSFSENKSFDAFWNLNATLERSFHAGLSVDTASGRWLLKAGYLGEQTIGRGLTIKDFQALGSLGGLRWKDLSIEIATWAQTYDITGDIFLVKINFPKYHVGFNSLYWLGGKLSEENSLYYLPVYSYQTRSIEVYGEAGIKQRELMLVQSENAVQNGDWSWGALFGISWWGEFWGWKADLNP